jgi:hypothetical protein
MDMKKEGFLDQRREQARYREASRGGGLFNRCVIR